MKDDDDWMRPKPLPEDVESSITTPHAHEDPITNPPLWLIWKLMKDTQTGVPYFPVLDTVCNSEDSARYHYRMVISHSRDEARVERIPANHRFASSLDHLQMDVHMAMWKARHSPSNRTGD